MNQKIFIPLHGFVNKTLKKKEYEEKFVHGRRADCRHGAAEWLR